MLPSHLAKEEEELKECTFQPKILKYSSTAKSKIPTTAHANTYLTQEIKRSQNEHRTPSNAKQTAHEIKGYSQQVHRVRQA
jgi:hypothetical protein